MNSDNLCSSYPVVLWLMFGNVAEQHESGCREAMHGRGVCPNKVHGLEHIDRVCATPYMAITSNFIDMLYYDSMQTYIGAGGYILRVSSITISRYCSSCVASYMDLSCMGNINTH